MRTSRRCRMVYSDASDQIQLSNSHPELDGFSLGELSYRQ